MTISPTEAGGPLPLGLGATPAAPESDALGRDTMPERYPYSMRDAVEKYVDLLLSAIGARGATDRRMVEQQ